MGPDGRSPAAEPLSMRLWAEERRQVTINAFPNFAVANDIAVKTMGDIKGKRVAWVRGSLALQKATEALLGFANLSLNDVQKVEVGGWADGHRRLHLPGDHIGASLDQSWHEPDGRAHVRALLGHALLHHSACGPGHIRSVLRCEMPADGDWI